MSTTYGSITLANGLPDESYEKKIIFFSGFDRSYDPVVSQNLRSTQHWHNNPPHIPRHGEVGCVSHPPRIWCLNDIQMTPKCSRNDHQNQARMNPKWPRKKRPTNAPTNASDEFVPLAIFLFKEFDFWDSEPPEKHPDGRRFTTEFFSIRRTIRRGHFGGQKRSETTVGEFDRLGVDPRQIRTCEWGSPSSYSVPGTRGS